MFCMNCGAKNDDKHQFCIQCGSRLEEIPVQQEAPVVETPAPAPTPAPVPAPTPTPVPAPEPTPAPAKKPRCKKCVGKTVTIIILSLLLVASLVVGAYFFFLRDYRAKALAEDAMLAYYEADAKAIFDNIPSDVLKAEYGSKADRQDAMDELEEELEAMITWYDEFFEEWTIEFKAVHVENVTGEALENLQEIYDDEYDCEVTAAKEVTVKLMAVMDGDYSASSTVLVLVKVDGQWYLDIDSLGFLY